ncbi:MAG: hypothetical protein RLY31_1309 [Bacteroidota bacterium]|jgi:beta-aspartyl-peptidase (threonine type)
MRMIQARLIVHGGAWNIPTEYVQDHIRGVSAAVSAVFPQLQSGLSALDAVEAAVSILEEDPTFDAGRGAFLNECGEVELDAMIMDGRDLGVGAVAALQQVLHPVQVARRVMESTEHCLLVGKGAQAFAVRSGFTLVPEADLLTERERAYFEQIRRDQGYRTRHPFEALPMDTVGAVAMDRFGNLAAATSTGGTARKLQGRVGDCPLPGAGAYADNALGAASATGWGESIMKVLLTKTACDRMGVSDADGAASFAISELARKVNGLGGIIAIDRQGRYGIAHNTPRMAYAYVSGQGDVTARITYPA